MPHIPRSPLILGLAGLLPFLWGAAATMSPDLNQWIMSALHPRMTAPHVQLFYGAIILSFMSGVLWGFATKADGSRETLGYILSVLPALWAFFTTGGGPTSAALNLMIGFAALLILDMTFARWGLAPPWWMPLRLLLTGIVLICLAVTAFA